MSAQTVIAVLGGTGAEGSGLALRWAAHGHEVLIGSRSVERAQAMAQQIAAKAGRSARVRGTSNLEAARAASVIVLAVPPAAQVSTAEEVKPALSGKLLIDVTAPLGVGLFPDMRLGWAAVAARAAGRRVLNLFSYTGAFSVHAAKAGAAEVVAVDTAAKAHARARRNFELSGLADARHETLNADAVKTLERFASRQRWFDIVVCDPPTFSHGPAGQFSVARDLARLAAASAAVLAPGGLLVFASNSTKLSVADLDRALGEGGAEARAELRIIERVGLPPDFPVAPGFPEGNYLKLAIAMRVP